MLKTNVETLNDIKNIYLSPFTCLCSVLLELYLKFSFPDMIIDYSPNTFQAYLEERKDMERIAKATSNKYKQQKWVAVALSLSIVIIIRDDFYHYLYR